MIQSILSDILSNLDYDNVPYEVVADTCGKTVIHISGKAGNAGDIIFDTGLNTCAKKSLDFVCDKPECVHCKDDACSKDSAVTIRGRCCEDCEERIVLSPSTITIEVEGGIVKSVYASPDLPAISVDLIDFDNLRDMSEEEIQHSRRQLEEVYKAYINIL